MVLRIIEPQLRRRFSHFGLTLVEDRASRQAWECAAWKMNHQLAECQLIVDNRPARNMMPLVMGRGFRAHQLAVGHG